MKRVEIPIWQYPDAKPIDGLPELGPVVKFMDQPEYDDYIKNGHEYNITSEPLGNGLIKHTGIIMFKAINDRFKLTPEQEIIRKFKKDAYYE